MALPSPFKEIKASDGVTLKWRGRTWMVSTKPDLVVTRVTKKTWACEPLVKLTSFGQTQAALITYDVYLKLEKWAKEAAT